MDRERIKEGKTYNYKTHNSEGRFKVEQVYQLKQTEKGGGSWFVVGLDKVKGKNVTVRPSQVSA